MVFGSIEEKRYSAAVGLLFSGLENRLARTLFLAALFILGGTRSSWAWVNPGFETGNLTGWTATTGNGGGLATGCGNPAVTVVPVGTAPNSAGGLPVVHSGNYAVQLYSSRGDDNHLDWARVEQTDTVPVTGGTCLSFWFAGVFESHHYDVGETANQSDSYLEADVIVGGVAVATLIYSWETNLTQIIQLSNTIVPAVGDGTKCDVNGNPNRWGYLPWTNYIINLCAYTGQQVTLRVTDYDCDAGGHYGFGYLDDVSWESCPPDSLVLTKANSPVGPVSQGQTITYTLTYHNSSTAGIDGMAVTDMIPAFTNLVPNSISSNPSIFNTSQSGNNLVWDVGYVASGGSGTLSFQVTVDQSCVTIINVANETDFLKPCGSPGNPLQRGHQYRGGLYPFSHAFLHLHFNGHPNLQPVPHPYRYGNRHLHPLGYPHVNEHPHLYPHPNTHPDDNGYPDGHGYSDFHLYHDDDRHLHLFFNSDPDAHRHSNRHHDRYFHLHFHRYCYLHIHGYFHTDRHFLPLADFHGHGHGAPPPPRLLQPIPRLPLPPRL